MPKGIQKGVAASLQPWLDFAAVVPANEEVPPPWKAPPELMDRVFEATGPQPRWPGSDFWVCTKFPALFGPFPADSLLHKREDAAQIVYKFFFDVRSALDWVAEAREVSLGQGLPSASISTKPQVVFGSGSQIITVHEGKVLFEDNREWTRFREAIRGVEIRRLRRCPVCRRIYYAVRDNKGACDLHLDVARVRRHRDPESRRKYEKTRKIMRLVRTGLPLSKARAAVESRARKGGSSE